MTNGVELSVLFSPLNNFRLELSGTYQKTEDKRNGFGDIDVAYSPNLLGYAKASYAFDTGKIGNGIFSLTANYVDKMEPYWDNTPQKTDNPGSPPKGGLAGKLTAIFYLGAIYDWTICLADRDYI